MAGEREDSAAEAERKALEALVVDNPDLECLEGLVGRFNVFEAMGAVNQEVRHSDFLRFLLDPNASHGLGDLFARRFLQAALAAAGRDLLSASLTPVELCVTS